MARSQGAAASEELPVIADLKRAIESSGQKSVAIAKGAGVSPALLTRFVRGGKGISLPAAAKLAEYLGLELVLRKRRSK